MPNFRADMYARMATLEELLTELIEAVEIDTSEETVDYADTEALYEIVFKANRLLNDPPDQSWGAGDSED